MHLQKLPKNVGDLDKFIAAKGFKSGPKSNKSPNLVTLIWTCRASKRPATIMFKFALLRFVGNKPLFFFFCIKILQKLVKKTDNSNLNDTKFGIFTVIKKFVHLNSIWFSVKCEIGWHFEDPCGRTVLQNTEINVVIFAGRITITYVLQENKLRWLSKSLASYYICHGCNNS